MQSWLELLASDQWRLAGQLGLFLALVMDRCSLATALVTIMLSHTLLTMSPGPPPIDQTWSQRMRPQHGVIPKISVHSHKMAVKHKIYKKCNPFLLPHCLQNELLTRLVCLIFNVVEAHSEYIFAIKENFSFVLTHQVSLWRHIHKYEVITYAHLFTLWPLSGCWVDSPPTRLPWTTQNINTKGNKQFTDSWFKKYYNCKTQYRVGASQIP